MKENEKNKNEIRLPLVLGLEDIKREKINRVN
jgi:hypothetical protein